LLLGVPLQGQNTRKTLRTTLKRLFRANTSVSLSKLDLFSASCPTARSEGVKTSKTAIVETKNDEDGRRALKASNPAIGQSQAGKRAGQRHKKKPFQVVQKLVSFLTGKLLVPIKYRNCNFFSVSYPQSLFAETAAARSIPKCCAEGFASHTS
jgi:hypothetical protein